MAAFLAVAFLLGVIGYSFAKSRKKDIREGTWLGVAGTKTLIRWNKADAAERSQMLARISIVEGSYRDRLLGLTWADLPDMVRMSLAHSTADSRPKR